MRWLPPIAAQGRAHFQMALDEKQHCFAIWLVQVQPSERAFGDFHTGANMICGFRAFANVMQKQRKIEQVRLFDLVQKFCVALIPFGLGLPKRMQVVDRHESVLVHRKAMRVIAHHQRINRREFGK